TNLKPAPKIFKEDCKIDWSQTRSQLHNFVRGLSPYPLAWSDLKILTSDMQTYKIFEIDPNVEDVQIPDGLGVGECFTVRNKQLFVICQDGAVRLLRLQAPGKKPMKDIDLLNGMRN
ncbi:MAG: methionyl-tRNA formyltransferase, partial [Porphyromonadaceae bacterium]|nr:methionyl-tRNA formyltransferase [Porphyromonadaceae bacterium]